MGFKKIELDINEKKNIINNITCRKENDFTKLCLFSHFDRDDKIDRYVVIMIKSLFELGFDIVFITTSEGIKFDELSKIDKYLNKIIVKKNIGYDFISWKTGLSEVDNYSKYEMILHINDSIFFPLVNPIKMFETMNEKSVDFWGICDSFTFKYHIESFFWVLNKKIINSDFYNKFWNECRTIDNKTELIKTYEVEFTSLVKKNDFTISSYISMQKLLDYAALNFNKYEYSSLYQSTPFHSFWDIIIKEFKAPFIKKNILCYSHKDYNIGTQFWEEYISEFTEYDRSLISDNLDRLNNPLIIDNNIDFYKNLNTFFNFIESIKSEKKFIIYGYGIVGQFVHAILKDSVVGIIDTNYEKVNNYQRRYDLRACVASPEFLHNFDFDEIIICAFGREEEIQKNLIKKNVDDCKIVKPSSYIFGSGLKFSNYITSFARTLRYIHFFNLKKHSKISLYSSSSIVLKYCNEYMMQSNLNPIENYTIPDVIENNSLSFFIESKEIRNKGIIPFYVN